MTTLRSNASTKEVHAVVKNISNALKAKDWSAFPFFAIVIQKLEQANNSLSEALVKAFTPSYAEQLIEKDDTRDDLVTGIGYILRGFMYMEDEIGKAARLIYKIFQSQGSRIQIQAYEIESTSISTILDLLETEELKALVDIVPGLNKFINKLREVNKDFQDTYRKSKTEGTSQEEVVAPSTQKKAVADILNKEFLPLLHIMSMTDKDNFGELKRAVTEFVESANSKILARETRRKNEEEVTEV